MAAYGSCLGMCRIESFNRACSAVGSEFDLTSSHRGFLLN